MQTSVGDRRTTKGNFEVAFVVILYVAVNHHQQEKSPRRKECPVLRLPLRTGRREHEAARFAHEVSCVAERSRQGLFHDVAFLNCYLREEVFDGKEDLYVFGSL
jgi:hypothetical protein